MFSIINFAGILNCGEKEEQKKLDPLIYMETLVFLLYRLIEVAPMGQLFSSSEGLNDNTVHLSMLAFMTTLLPSFCRDGSSRFLSDCLKKAIQDIHLTSAEIQNHELSVYLWILFIGGISVLKREDHRSLICGICERLGLQNWPAVRRQLCVFPWINTLHKDPGRRLWEDAWNGTSHFSPKPVQSEA